MTSRNGKTKEIFNRVELLELLPTLEMRDIIKLKFRTNIKAKWGSMVFCEDKQRKMYLCNVCNVSQYGEKNLVCHLSGKKHNVKMDTVRQVYLPKETDSKTSTKATKNAEKPTETRHNKDIKDKEKPSEDNNSKNKSVSTIQPSKPQPKAASKPSATKPASNKVAVAKSTIINATKSDSKGASTNVTASKETAQKLKISVDQKTLVAESASAKEKTDLTTPTTDCAVSATQSESTKPMPPECSSKKPCENKSKQNEQSIDVDELADQNNDCIVKETTANVVNKNNISASSSSSQPHIVLNPAAMKKKIFCVPLSKLISVEPPAERKEDNTEKNNAIEDAVAASESLKDVNKDKRDKINIIVSPSCAREKVVAINSSNYFPTSSLSQSASFETVSDVTEILGLLGVEYVIKVVKNMKDRSPKFQCTLCNITTQDLSMQNHLLGYNHRLKFCEKHYPTALRHYRQYISHIPEGDVFKVMAPILKDLAKAIEKHHGRETPYLCYESSFTKNRQNIVETVFNRRHASENSGPSFTHVLDSKDIDLLIANATTQSNLQVSNEYNVNSQSSFNTFNNPNLMMNQNRAAYYPNYQNVIQPRVVETVDDETHKRMVDMFLRDTRKTTKPGRHRIPSRSGKRSRSRSKSPGRKRRRDMPLIKSQWDLERKSLSPLRDGDIWQAYRHMVDQSVRELNASFDVYNSNPEEHPSYKQEWEKFWKRRKDELIAAGINHRSHNYQSEWILFFNARLEELYNHDVENIKIKCRERLCLPMTNSELSNSKYHVHISDNVSDYPSQSKEPENITENISGYANRNRTPESITENVSGYANRNRTPENLAENVSGYFSRNKSPENITENRIECVEIREEINVIHVLRLLTALEDHLGSLGPSITKLLAKALQICKQNPDKANIILLTIENCAILETAKEKFTGLIISKILDPAQERAVKKAINDTELLLDYATKIQTEEAINNAELNINLGTSELQSLPRLNTKSFLQKPDRFDHTELAAKLASSLISQGKTRINQEQLQQIVQVYSLIEQKKQQKETASGSRSTQRTPPALTFSPNETSRQENTNNNFSSQPTMIQQRQQAQNFSYNNNPADLNRNYSNAYSNTTMISTQHNMTTSNNNFSANMARIDNPNLNNPNQMEYLRNGQNYQYNQYQSNCQYFDNGET